MEGNPNTWSVDEKLQSRSSTETPLSHSSQLELVGKNALSTFSPPEMQSFDSQSIFSMGFPDGTGLKKILLPPLCRRHGFKPWIGKIPGVRNGNPTPEFLPGESHGQRSLADYSPWGCKQSNTTECTHTHTHIYTIIYEISAKFFSYFFHLFLSVGG